MKLSVIIPAYNELITIEAVVRRVQGVNLGPIEKEIIVVDDGSRDGTIEVLKVLSGIRHILHERNAGKGAALTTGFQAATGDIVLIQDADLEYHPEDYRTVIQPIVDGACDAVMGSRFLLYKPKFFVKRRSPYLHPHRATPPRRNLRKRARERRCGCVRLTESRKPPRHQRSSKKDSGPPGRATDRHSNDQ